MKPIKNQATSIAGLSALSTEAKLCFGAAGGSFVLGMVGYAVNTLTTTETTLSAFLVISAFYGFLGIVSVLKGNPEAALRALPEVEEQETETLASYVNKDGELAESAA